MLKRYHSAAIAVAALVITSGSLFAAGNYSNYPIVGGAAFCDSTVTGASTFGGATGQGQATNGSICAQTVPAGPPALTGTEILPLDTGLAGGASPQTAVIPATSLANGYGGTVTNATTGTGQNPVVADGISNYIYIGAGTATFATFTLPPNPIQNQKFCLSNAGSGVLTTTSVVVGTSGQTFVGVAPTSIPVATAVGTAGTVTLSSNCWIYISGATKTWVRVL